MGVVIFVCGVLAVVSVWYGGGVGSLNDPADEFEKNMLLGKGKGPVYDWRNRLPGDVVDLTKAVARSAASAAGYVGRVANRVLNPFSGPDLKKIHRMVENNRAETDYWYLSREPGYVPPNARGRGGFPSPLSRPKRMPKDKG